MPNIVVLDWTLEKLIKNQIPAPLVLNYIEVPPLPINVVYDVPAPTFSLIQRDTLLNQIMRDEYQKALVAVVQTRVIPRLRVLDEQAGSASFKDYAVARRLAFKSIELDLDKGMKDGDAAFSTRLKRLETEKKEYKGYRAKVGKRVAKFTLGVGAAAVGVAGTVGTMGAALPLAIIGLYRSIMEGTKLLRDVLLEAEGCEKNVVKGLASLKLTYGKDKNLGRLREIGTSLMNSVTAFPFNTKFNTNGATISAENDLWRGKLTHLRFIAHELATDLNELLEKSDRLLELIEGDPTKKNYVKTLKSVHSDVNLLLEKGFYIPSMAKRIRIPETHQRAERGLDIQSKLDVALKEFIRGRGEWVDKLDFVINAIVDLGLMGASLGVGGAPTSVLDKVGMALSAPGDLDTVVVNVLYEGAQQFDVKKKTTGLFARLKDFHKARKAKFRRTA